MLDFIADLIMIQSYMTTYYLSQHVHRYSLSQEKTYSSLTSQKRGFARNVKVLSCIS